MLAATLAPVAFAQGPASEPPEVAHGLIVRLKQPQAHADLARKRALAAQETRRWDALLTQAGVAQRASFAHPRRRGVGRDQVLLEFGQPLAPGEAEALADRLRQHPDVDWVAPNVREQRLQIDSSTPVDPMFAQQWWLHEAGGSDANAIADRRRGVPGFLSAWAAGIPGAEGREGSVVAVLDTGITPHPELQGRLLPGRDFVSDDLFGNDGQPGRDDDPTDPGDWVDASELSDPRLAKCAATRSSWHGTAIAGVLAASSDNGSGVAGAIRRGQVLPVRVAGKCGATVADIIDGLRWAAGLEVDGQRNPHPARVVNLSFGGTRACGREYQDTIDELRTHGVVVVAAAGNAHGSVTRPASCAGVVGVVALNRDGFKAHYSSFGPVLAASGIATVGGDDAQGAWGPLLADGGIVTLSNSGTTGHAAADYAAYHGTSFAAPMVAAALTLMLAVNPELSVEQLIAGLRASARPHLRSSLLAECSDRNPGRCACTTAVCGAGTLDVKQALTYARSPADYTAPVWPEERVESPELALAVTLGSDRTPNDPSVDDEPVAGGGALGGGWLLLLAAGVAALRRGGENRPQPLKAEARTA